MFGEGPTSQPVGDFENHKEFMKLKYTADDVRYTTKGKTVYAITLGVPEAGKTMTFKSFKKKIKALKIENVSVIGSNQLVPWELTKEGLQVKVPIVQGNNAVVFKIECN